MQKDGREGEEPIWLESWGEAIWLESWGEAAQVARKRAEWRNFVSPLCNTCEKRNDDDETIKPGPHYDISTSINISKTNLMS